MYSSERGPGVRKFIVRYRYSMLVVSGGVF